MEAVPKNQLYNQENNNLSAFCQSYQLFFEHANGVLSSLAQDLKQASYPDTLDQGVGLTDQDRVGRNHPCPCGSGKKYKKCSGKLNQPS